MIPIERTGEYRGLYHVLGGALSPIDGVDPEDLKIAELVAPGRATARCSEVVLATNPTTTGEATALHIAELLRDQVTVTRLASGLPVGADLEHADEVTLGRALAGRQSVAALATSSGWACRPSGPNPRIRRRSRGFRRRFRSLSPIRSCRRRSGRGAHQFHLPSSSISDGHEQGADDASRRSAPRAPCRRPFSLMKMICEVAKAPIAIANSSAAAVTIRPVRSSPIATASESRGAAVARLLDPREQEDAVVGGEAEGDREQQDRHRLLERALARVVEQALEAAVLEDQHEDPEDGAQVEEVHQQRLDRQHTEPVIRKRMTRVATTTIASAIGRWSTEARLEVDEVRP